MSIEYIEELFEKYDEFVFAICILDIFCETALNKALLTKIYYGWDQKNADKENICIKTALSTKDRLLV